MKPGKILLADDDDVLSSMLGEYLDAEGFQTSQAPDGETALQLFHTDPPDLVVLDIMMPKINGIEVLKEIRKNSALPVIMLTARGDDLDRILGLELGADDYIPKPCNPRELVARIRAILRRTESQPTLSSTERSVGDLTLNEGTREVVVGPPGKAREMALTQTEFDILIMLIDSPGALVKKSELSLEILGRPLGQWDRSIDVHISNLRRKLGPDSFGEERIRTVRGTGYLYHIQSTAT